MTGRDRILLYVKDCSMRGEFPTIREIGMHVELRSSGTVHNHLMGLARDGLIVYEPTKSRSVRYIRKSEDICKCCGGNGWARHERSGISSGETVRTDIAGASIGRRPESRS